MNLINWDEFLRANYPPIPPKRMAELAAKYAEWVARYRPVPSLQDIRQGKHEHPPDPPAPPVRYTVDTAPLTRLPPGIACFGGMPPSAEYYASCGPRPHFDRVIPPAGEAIPEEWYADLEDRIMELE